MKLNSNRIGPAAVRAVELALLALLAVAFAQGTWKLLGPRETARSPATEIAAPSVDLAPAGVLLGVPPQPKAQEQPNPVADVILTGIYRSGESGGFALVRIGNQPPKAVHAGAELRSGVKLSKLAPDHVVFLRGAEEFRLSLASRAKRITPVQTKG